MRYLLKSVDNEEFRISGRYPEGFHAPEVPLVDNRILTGGVLHAGTHQEWYLEHMAVWQSRISAKEEFRLRGAWHFPAVQLRFVLSGSHLLETDLETEEVITWSSGQHNIQFFPRLSVEQTYHPGAVTEVLQILVDPVWFGRLLPGEGRFAAFRAEMDGGAPARIHDFHLPVTPAMLPVLKDILSTERKGFFKRLQLEAKVIELILLQLEQSGQYDSHPIGQSPRMRDIDKMYQVRSIIQGNYRNPCSLIDLAHQVGTNEYNLKKSFKELFGTTVFGYMTDVKMQEAREKLLKGEMNINEVADHIGYKNANHFSVAFKKHFGYIPSELRKS